MEFARTSAKGRNPNPASTARQASSPDSHRSPERRNKVRNIGLGIRELRRRRGLGVRELAIRSGVSHSSISLIERDKISPSIDTLAAILEALARLIHEAG